MSRIFFLIYSGLAYLLFYVTFIYTIGFVNNLAVFKTIDGVPQVDLVPALGTNFALIGIFALQHSLMARQTFKRWWITIIPEPIERSTYILFSNLVLILLIWKWEPIGGNVWTISSPFISGILVAVSLLGFALVIASTFMINHFDFFGLRQTWKYFRNQPYEPVHFSQSYLYRYVRYPLYLGFGIGFWATPVMTLTHLILAVLITGYILAGIYLEEKDMVDFHGKSYVHYKKHIPMLIPSWWKSRTAREDGPVRETFF